MGLVAHWKLDGNAKDSLGEYNGFEVGGPTYSSGKIGDCYDNTGNNAEGIELIRDDDFGEYEDLYSFSLFFKSTTTSGDGGARLISRDASEYPTIIIRQNDSSPQELYFYEATNDSGNVVNVNEWHHLAFTIDTGSNSSQLFIDGELIDSGGVNNDTSARPYVIGGNTEGDGDVSGGNFIGKIDDVRLYDHILSQKEVKQLSQAKVIHYTFDQTEYTDTVADSSANNYPGEIIRSPTSTTDTPIGQRAVDFQSGSNCVKINSAPDFSEPNELTISVWVKSNQSSWQNTGTFVSRRNNDQFVLHPDGGASSVDWYVHTDENGWQKVSHTVDDIQSWNHYVLTYTDGELKAYLNGDVVGTRGVGNTLASSSSPITVGRDDDGDKNYGNERMSDLRLYATALSDDEVKDIYEQRASIDSGGNLHTLQLTESEDRFDEFVGSVREDTDVLGSQDGFDEVYRLDARENGSYEDFLTGRVRTGDWNNSGPGNNLYLVLWLKGNKFPDGGFRGTFIKKPAPDTNEYQQYILRADGDNSRNEYFRLFYNNNDDTSFSFIGDPKIFTESEFEKRTQISSTGETLFDSFSEIGPAPASLVGWWPLDGDVRDYSGNGNHGTNNGASITSGLGKSAYEFDGSSDYVYMNSGPSFRSVTLSAWLYPTQLGSDNYQWFVPNSDIIRSYIRNDSDKVRFRVEGDSTTSLDSNVGLSENTWVHVSHTYDQTTGKIKIYINGSLEGTANQSSSSEFNITELYIGADGFQNYDYYHGKIQDVRIYDRALNEKEVKILYNMTNPEQKQQVIVDEDSTIITKNQFSEII